MPERVPCEFHLVRYVPDVVKGEFVNIGVLLREANTDTSARVRFTRDWTRVRCIDAHADIALLEDLEQEIAQRLQTGPTAREPRAVLTVLEDTLSNSVQLTEARAALAENLTTELEQLMRLYVEPLSAPRTPGKVPRKLTGRPALQHAMRSEFERAGVWALMTRRMAAERYTRRGDPLRLDCGYRKDSPTNPAIRIFQAVSLDGDLEMARVLAHTAPQLREGILRLEHAPLELTAVVEPRATAGSGEAQERYDFGVHTMEQEQIRVLTLSGLVAAAQTARQDLNL